MESMTLYDRFWLWMLGRSTWSDSFSLVVALHMQNAANPRRLG
jgi:hypothetical protein